MKALKFKDLRRRELLERYENRLLLYKSLSCNEFLPPAMRLDSYRKLVYYGLKVKKSAISNRCVWTNRGSSINVKFGLSRIAARELVLSGKLVGVFKRSW